MRRDSASFAGPRRQSAVRRSDRRHAARTISRQREMRNADMRGRDDSSETQSHRAVEAEVSADPPRAGTLGAAHRTARGARADVQSRRWQVFLADVPQAGSVDRRAHSRSRLAKPRREPDRSGNYGDALRSLSRAHPSTGRRIAEADFWHAVGWIHLRREATRRELERGMTMTTMSARNHGPI